MDNVTDQTRVTVPREPTEAMLDAFWHQTGESKEMRTRVHHRAKLYWSAMLAAAPATSHTPAPAIGGERFSIQERDDDMLIAERDWQFGWRCIARRPKLMKNGEWRPVAERIAAALSTPAPAQPSEVEAIISMAQFLCDRLDDLEWSDADLAATCRDYMGHVDPAYSRLKAALAEYQPNTPEKGNG